MNKDKYIITKRTECDTCHGQPHYAYSKDDPNDRVQITCFYCSGRGTVITEHDFDEILLSRLAKLRWNPRFTDNGTEWQEFDGMEMKDE